MPGGRIDRESWAREVHDLIVRFDPGPRGDGNKSAFARRVKVTTRTLERWAQCKNDVKVETVRSVIEALQLDQREAAELLARIGFHIGTMPPAPVDPGEDPVIKMIIADPQWSNSERAALIKRELDRIEREQAQRLADYEWFLRQRREARGTA